MKMFNCNSLDSLEPILKNKIEKNLMKKLTNIK